MKTDSGPGVRKDVGTGVFRDRDGDVIPRSRFEEDPDLDVEVDPVHFYAMRLRTGLPRDPEIEKGLDLDKVAELLPGGLP
jgi:hypothetical protein